MNLTQLLTQSQISVKELSNEELKKLQGTLLDMFKDIYSACEKHGVKVMLSGGCCLGAIRHNGFIPWDDDMDIMLMRHDYKRLPEILATEFGNKYQCVGPNISTLSDMAFMRIGKTGTVIRSIYDNPEHTKPIFIDVFPIDNIPDSWLKRCFSALVADTLHYMALCLKYYDNRNCIAFQLLLSSKEGRKEISRRLRIGKLLSSLTSYTNLFNMLDKFISRYPNTTRDVGVPCSRRYLREIYPRATILPTIQHTFEDIQAPLPHDYDVYLKTLYKNYMQLPPEDQRKHAFWIEIKL